jgi:hypothetical protein
MLQLGMEMDFHLIRYVIAWILMLLIAITNGAFRQLILARVMSELRAHQLSTLIGSVLMGIFIWAVVRIWPLASTGQALLIGIIWLALTVAFEFVFGRFVAHRSWSQLLGDYNVFKGRLWAVFLIWLTLAPYVFFRFHCA